MKPITAFVLAVALLLGGCHTVRESDGVTAIEVYDLTLLPENLALQRTTSQYRCDAAALASGKYPEVQAKGGTAEFECVRKLHVTGLPTDNPDPPDPPDPPTGEWVTGKSTASVPTTARPARGAATPDPTFKNAVYRVSDDADPVRTFSRNDYSRRQAFNADNSWQLTYSEDGFWHVFDANKYSYGKKLNGLAGDSEPQWHATDPDKLYYLGQNGVGLKLYELTISANTSRVVADWGARLKARWSGATYAWTKSEGSPSADGRYWCLMVDNANFGSLGLFTYDLQTDAIIAYLDTNGDRPDHVSMSPSGNYCVPSWTSSKGTVAYSRDFKTNKQVNKTSEHSDLALLPGGDDAYVSIDYSTNQGEVFFVNLRTGNRTTMFPTYLSGTARAMHFSGKGYGVPGWVLISFYADYGGAMQWMDRKNIIFELKADPTPYNVSWTRVTSPSSDGYFFEPVSTISRDGSRVSFTSAWNSTAKNDINAYQVRIPALPAAGATSHRRK